MKINTKTLLLSGNRGGNDFQPNSNDQVLKLHGKPISVSRVAIAAAQMMLMPTLLAWSFYSYADCSDGPSPTQQDTGEGAVKDASPDANAVTDPDSIPSVDPVVSPTSSSDPNDNGDGGDGGGAGGSVGGTDGAGTDVPGSTLSFSTTTDTDILFGPLDGGGGGSHIYMEAADPIDLIHADKSHVQVDYASEGAAQLRMARVYHSNNSVNNANVTVNMGVGWHMYYDRSLQYFSGNAVRLHRANGQAIDFTYNGSTWNSVFPTGVLTQVSGGWTYVNRRDGIETYDTNGRLVGMAHAGLAVTMQYDGLNRLVKILNPFGKSLALGYDASSRVNVVTLPDGSTLRYGYDARNNLASTQFRDGSVRQYAYENSSFPHALTGILDESGRRRLTWTYDSTGRPNGGYYGAGTGAVNIGYNGSQITSVDSRGTYRVRSFSSLAGRQVITALSTSATTNSSATSWGFAYDSNGNMQSVTSRSGEIHQISRDARGRPLTSVRAVGTPQVVSTQTTWHPTFHVPTQTVRAGVTNNFTIDSSGRITKITSVSGTASVVTYSATYNAQNLLQSATDARGRTLTYSYDNSGNMLSVTNAALGQTTYYSGYNAHGQPASIQRPDGTTVTRSYDTRGRLAARTDRSGTTTFAYDAAGRATTVTAPDGSWTTRSYDSAGLLSGVTNNRGETTVVTRDTAGEVTTQSTYNSAGTLTSQSKRQIDAVGRLAANVDSRGYSTLILYGADGRQTGTTNPLGMTTGVRLDPLDRIVTVTQPNTTAVRQAGGAATKSSQYAYTPANKAASVVDTQVVATAYVYDGFNRRLSEAGNDAGGIGVVRNSAGDVVSNTDARGTTLGIAHDAIGRVTAVTFAGANDRTFTYVSGHTDHLLSAMTDSFGNSASWTYDGAGRMLTQQQTVYGLQHTLRVVRDTLGRPTSITYPSGMVLGMSYSADVISTMTINSSTLLNSIAYVPQTGLASSWRWGNGAVYSRAFDADGRITSVGLGSVQRSYIYDPAGNIAAVTDVSPSGSKRSNYTYDEAGQLVGYSSPTASQTFTYDTNGNRLSQAGTGLYTSNYTYASNSNRLTTWAGFTYQYNADGSPSNDGRALQYDLYGRLSQVSDNATKSVNNYNALGQRVLKRIYQYVDCSPGGRQPAAVVKAASNKAIATTGTCVNWPLADIVRYVYDDHGRLIGEYDSFTGYSQETVWFNNLPVATFINGVLYYVNADNIGAPRSVVRSTDNVELWRWDSDPFGSAAPTAPNPASGTIVYNMRFPGQIADSETGFYQNGTRYYMPLTGRYIEADRAGLAGGLSRYAYVGGNPLTLIDPTGQGWEHLVAPAVGALVNGASNGLNYYSQGCSFWAGFENGAVGGAIAGEVSAMGAPMVGVIGGAIATEFLNQRDGVMTVPDPNNTYTTMSPSLQSYVWNVGASTLFGGALKAATVDEAAAGGLGINGIVNSWTNVGGVISGANAPAACKRP